MSGIVVVIMGLAAASAACLCLEFADRRQLGLARDRLRSRMAGASGASPAGLAGPRAAHVPAFLSKIFGSTVLGRLATQRSRSAAGLPSPGLVDQQMPELIAVVAMAMQGGMTFEWAFSLYAEKFDTDLARACRSEVRKMRSGVEWRDTVLDELADRLGSRQFRRFAETVERSVRFGSALGPVLHDLADEIRATLRTQREEATAKTPTKMLVPTGMLILPAMLIFVAGPFLLEMLEQF